MNIKLLIVEDDKSLIQLYTDSLVAYPDINVEFSLNKEDALAMIKSNNYDAAIIDLKLDNPEIPTEGSDIAKEINENLRFPIVIYSANIEELSEDFKSKESVFLKIYSRYDKEITTIFDEIKALKATGIIDILNKKGHIESYLNEIFWNYLTHTMPFWIEESKTKDTKNALLRYTLSHLQEYLEINNKGEYDNYYSLEVYIKGPIKKHQKTIFTGDIVKNEEADEYYLVITPTCDLVIDSSRPTPKAKFITLVKIVNIEDLISDIPEGNKKNNKRESIKKNNEYAYHFLPKYLSFFDGGVVCFQDIKSILLTDILNQSKYKIELCISTSFKKDIVSRFSSYYSRQGQPIII
ncbi:response regulator [Emticicia sp. 17c]|uniref:response regulator n=1 Tax=Emticicia sp. 17c TaxID=3127704 RepID=UPI00301CFE2A